MNTKFIVMNLVPEKKIAEQWHIWVSTEDGRQVAHSWATQSRGEAITKTRAMYPKCHIIKAKKINDLTNWTAWFTHPTFGYMC